MSRWRWRRLVLISELESINVGRGGCWDASIVTELRPMHKTSIESLLRRKSITGTTQKDRHIPKYIPR